ncbi:MAG: hypothetical protein JXQ71_14270 [Verrucomicrobia bacterium]|nr:hypothetical protein [Verrucomicrobiota bacterium]
MPSQFGDFVASELFCPKCQRSQPVRQRLLLVLPSGELFEYLCAKCGTSLGQRTVTTANPLAIPTSTPPSPSSPPGRHAPLPARRRPPQKLTG